MPVFDLTLPDGHVLELTSDYTATDDVTPVSIDDSQGSTGDLTVTFDARGRVRDWKTLKGLELGVTVTGRPRRSLGRVAHVSGGDAAVSLAIDTVLNKAAVVRHLDPYTGTLGGLVRTWLTACGIPRESVTIDPRVTGIPVQAVGFYDNVWLRLKQITAALRVEIAAVENRIVLRPLRTIWITLDDDLLVSAQWDVDDTSMAKRVRVLYYDPTQILAGDMTPDYSRSTYPGDLDADAASDPNVEASPARNRLPAGWLGSRSQAT